jgi:hypothetical protein
MTTPAIATVKGGFWESNGVGSLASVSGENGLRSEIEAALNRQGTHKLRAILQALATSGPGTPAIKTRTRVAATVELGGLRPIETITLINRNTTPADASEVQTDLLQQSTNSSFGANPPPNLDRNPLGTR